MQPLSSSASTLGDPSLGCRLVRIPVQQGPPSQWKFAETCLAVGGRHPDAMLSIESMLAQTLHAPPTAAAQVLQHSVSDLRTQREHHGRDSAHPDAFFHQRLASHPSSVSHDQAHSGAYPDHPLASQLSSPSRDRLSSCHQSGLNCKTLHPSMANRLIELTSLSDSRKAGTSHRYTSGASDAVHGQGKSGVCCLRRPRAAGHNNAA